MAVDPTFQFPYFGGTIALTTHSSPVRLITLILALAPHVPEACTFLRINAQTGNASPVFFGGDTVSDTNYAYSLAAEAEKEYESATSVQGVPLGRIWIWCEADANLGIEVIA